VNLERDRESSGHVTVPEGRGLWIATPDRDRRGPGALSVEAELILGIALTFPQFQAPGKQELWVLQKERAENSASRYGHFGLNRVQGALNELQERGFYGWRRTSGGRKPGGKADWAYVRSFGNEPWKHMAALKTLTKEEIFSHWRAFCHAWASRGEPGATVISIAEYHRKTA
jgi:hypothetical protein